jgi:hypothetical protein
MQWGLINLGEVVKSRKKERMSCFWTLCWTWSSIDSASNKIKDLWDPETSSGWQIGSFYEFINLRFCRWFVDTFDGAKPRFLNRGKKRRSVSTLSIPRPSDRGVEWVDFKFFKLNWNGGLLENRILIEKMIYSVVAQRHVGGLNETTFIFEFAS